jgi:hypothetical protein
VAGRAVAVSVGGRGLAVGVVAINRRVAVGVQVGVRVAVAVGERKGVELGVGVAVDVAVGSAAVGVGLTVPST